MEHMGMDARSDVNTMKSLNILYFSCHEILEYDDLKMLTDYGHRVFSLGSFTDPHKNMQHEGLRPYLDQFKQPELLEHFYASGCDNTAKRVSRDFCKNFDVVIINHHLQWFTENEEAFNGMPVIMRPVGQSNEFIEHQYKENQDKFKIVRYSNREVDLPGFAKTDAVVYFAKEKNLFGNWHGGGVGLTLHHHLAQRNLVGCPQLNDWLEMRNSVPIELYGKGNESVVNNNGILPQEALASKFSGCAFYCYVYTSPPSYTLSLIEAMSAGVPIISPSADFVARSVSPIEHGIHKLWTKERYEVPSFLGDECGFVYDNITDAVSFMKGAVANSSTLTAMSTNAKDRASKLFAPQIIAKQWTDLLLGFI